MPKALTVFAHQDDETIALGARLGRFSTAHLVHVTDGAPRNEQDSRSHGCASLGAYRDARRNEFRQALRVAGIANCSRECLAIPDQEAALGLRPLTWRVFHLLQKYQPEAVFTHPYEGGHPDHDACAFAVHHAVALLRQTSGHAPLIIEAAFYHAGQRGMDTGTFLTATPAAPQAVYFLSPEERQRKATMFACFRTQQQVLRNFSTDYERFRVAPRYDFGNPPHPGALLYDQFPWGMTSSRFCELAHEADRVLTESAVMSCQ